MTNTQKVSQLLKNLKEEELEAVSTLLVTFLDMLPVLETQPLEEVVRQAFELGISYAKDDKDALSNARESILAAWEQHNANA